MTIRPVRSLFMGKRGAARMSKQWFKRQLPNIPKDKLIGVHGTTINGVPGNWGSFDIKADESKTFVTEHDLFLLDVAHIETAVDYALGWASSSTGNREDSGARTGLPGIICLTDTDETKIQRQFGNVIVIPKGTQCTAVALPICEKLKKDVDRANMGHRLGLGIIGMGLESAGIRILPDAEPDPVPHNKWDKPLEE